MNVRALFALVGVVGTVGAYAACSSDEATVVDDAGTSPTGTGTSTTPKPTSTTTTTAPTPDSSVPDASSPDATADASTDASTDASDGATAATWTAVHTIISARCGNNCHLKANGPSGNLRLDNKNMAYANLVNVDVANNCGAITKRVVPSNAAQSKLYVKVSSPNATIANCGNRMPNGGAMLPAAEIAAFQSWINAGALNN